MSTENRSFNTSRATRRLLGLLAGLTVWHLMSRFAWTMLAYPRTRNERNIFSYNRMDPVESLGQDASWWDYFIGYTSKFGDIVSSHYYGYSLTVLAFIAIGIIAWVVSWIFDSSTGTNKRGGDINFTSSSTVLWFLVGATAGPGIAFFTLAFM